ncbi:GNAT family N-acetyltransferase [Occultella gossypii]|uniref:GNAT family N-acetyltransferase n=1 Tax=Occultella gossypii TaxID=2800820 RepID=A0ABS7SEW9_9MICO|nr:GNAT family protein [Occultella gossypii]MBZ2198680.1 GNAT family N-acetyltransferase [Occultella gossypii]
MKITGTRVELRDWTIADDPRIRSLLDPARPWHLTNGPYFGPPTAESMEAMRAGILALAAMDETDRPDPRGMLAVVDRSDDALVGAVSWYWESHETDWRRLGIGIHDEAYWGRGLATEAMALWTTYLFDATDTLRLDFATYSGNEGMIGVGRRLGFVEEGRFRKARRWSGGVHDSVVMGTLREEWEARRAAWPATSS